MPSDTKLSSQCCFFSFQCVGTIFSIFVISCSLSWSFNAKNCKKCQKMDPIIINSDFLSFFDWYRYRQRLETSLVPSWNDLVKSRKIIYPSDWKDEKWNRKYNYQNYQTSSNSKIRFSNRPNRIRIRLFLGYKISSNLFNDIKFVKIFYYCNWNVKYWFNFIDYRNCSVYVSFMDNIIFHS